MINKIMIWNYRWVGKRNFIAHVHMLMNSYNPKVLALLETQISNSKAKAIFKALGFNA